MNAGRFSKKISKGKRWLLVFAVRGMGGVAGALSTWVASRVLGAEAAGVIFLAMAIVTVLSTTARLGLESTVVRFISVHASKNEWAQASAVLRIALKWAGIASLTIATVISLSAGILAKYAFHMPALAPVLQIMAWLIPLMTLYWLFAQGFVGLRKPEIATTLQNNCLPLGFIVLLLAGVHLSVTISHQVIAALAYTSAGALTLLLGWVMWRRMRIETTPISIDVQALRHSASPNWIVTTMNQIVIWGGQIVAGTWLSSSLVAQLAAANRCATLIGLTLIVATMLTSPRFAALHHQGNVEALKTLVRRVTRTLILIVTPISICILLLAHPIMRLFGEDFSSAAPLLRIFVFAQWVNVSTGSVGVLLQMTGHERDIRNVTLISGSLSVLLAITLTSAYGAIGAACATAVAIIVQNGGALLMVRRRLGFFTF